MEMVVLAGKILLRSLLLQYQTQYRSCPFWEHHRELRKLLAGPC